MSMTDQERAAMLAKAFDAIAQGKNVQIYAVSKGWTNLDAQRCLSFFQCIDKVRLVPETITATVTIPKPLKEWPSDNSNVWIDKGSKSEKVCWDWYKNNHWETELKAGTVYATEALCNEAMESMRKFRTGELS